MKKIFSSLASLIAVSALSFAFTGCGNSDDKPQERVFAFVAKDVNIPYMQKVYEGLTISCKAVGATALYKGPESATAEKQIEIINQLVAQNVAGIMVAANDANALQPALQAAQAAGIAVISGDSAVNPQSRMTPIQQADPEKIGRLLIQSAFEMVNGDGGIAILSSTATATNQNIWIGWMKKELEENPRKYAKTPLVKIVYGDDEPTRSTSETQALLKDPSIKIIIAPTTVGMLAAGKVLQDKNSSVKLTGLGQPSEMAPFIECGICPWMYLWNPVDIGALAGYTLDALNKKIITGKTGDSFEAGPMGKKIIVAAGDGGTEIMLGEPFKFDAKNIAEWKLVY